MGQHALLSPSDADRWATCSGSIALSEGIPDESGEDADEGTAAHLIYNLCLSHGYPAADYLGVAVRVGTSASEDFDGAILDTWTSASDFQERRRFEMTHERIELIDTAVKNTVALREEHGAGLLHAGYEERLPLESITGEEGAHGTGDVVFIAEGLLDIHDLKFGRREVRPESRQLKIYARAAAEKYAALGPFSSVRLVIHQPKIHATPQVCVIGWDDLEAFREDISARAATVLLARKHKLNWIGKDSSYLTPSLGACRYCQAASLGRCPEHDKLVADVIGEEFPVMADGTAPIQKPGAWPLEELGTKLLAVSYIEAWVNNVKAAAYAAAMNGNKVLHHKLVLGKKGPRAWVDKDQAEADLKKMRLKHDEMYVSTVKSPTQIEGIFGPKGSAPSPKRWGALQKNIGQTDAKPSLVPETDSRPEYVVRVVQAEEFPTCEAPSAPAEPQAEKPSFNPDDMI